MTQGNASIRQLTAQDVSWIAPLANNEGWNQIVEDWHTVLLHSPEYCFAAVHRGQVVGTVTAYRYSDALAWIGMMIVRDSHRGRGIGRELMQTVLQSLLKSGTETIKLDATPMGLSLYRALGFEREGIVCRFERVSLGPIDRRSSPDARLQGWRTKLAMFDKEQFGADRHSLLERLIETGRAPPVATTRDGDGQGPLNGYGCTRSGVHADYCGPIVATDDIIAARILDALTESSVGRRTFVDVLMRDSNRERILRDRGFSRQRELVRMRYGRESGVALGPSIFASAGPELG